MPRTVYVLPEGADPVDHVEQAQEAGAGEIVVGIPPALAHLLNEENLPTTYTEDDDEPVAPPDDAAPVTRAEFEALQHQLDLTTQLLLEAR